MNVFNPNSEQINHIIEGVQNGKFPYILIRYKEKEEKKEIETNNVDDFLEACKNIGKRWFDVELIGLPF